MAALERAGERLQADVVGAAVAAEDHERDAGVGRGGRDRRPAPTGRLEAEGVGEGDGAVGGGGEVGGRDDVPGSFVGAMGLAYVGPVDGHDVTGRPPHVVTQRGIGQGMSILIFANVVAAFPSYWLNRKWAWGKGGRSHMVKEVLPFWVMSLTSIAFSMVGAAAARALGNAWHLQHVEQTILVLAANVASFGIFWILKLIVFNHTFRVPALDAEAGARVRLNGDGDGPPPLDASERAGIR